ncbi:hypothetical protein [Acinetobacter haemolyticus]|uniref:hypothetical protein n=1 Tax=Acinetobacter haemolyticus TaxID=29430 RepID=UPI00129872FC|nr:hypothetical protein [Acinetobacter haemolyticus]NAS08120.1 hypothetical protein [Acinetobacter haemolyticus]
MIKTEVVFEDDCLFCNDVEIEISVHEDYEKFYVVKGKIFATLEQAVKKCLEQGYE